MHMGRTEGPDTERALFGGGEGAQAPCGRIQGCYVHGIFGSDAWRHAFLSGLRARENSGFSYRAALEAGLNALAERMERHLNIDGLIAAGA